MTSTTKALLEMRSLSQVNNIGKWARNMAKNVSLVRLPYTFAPIDWEDTVMVFASGASLSCYAGRYKELNYAPVSVVATPTNVAWLQSEGVDIDLVVVMDQHPIMAEMLQTYNGPVIAHPGVDPGIADLMTYYYKLYIDGDETWNEVQDAMFPMLPSGYLAEYGCVTNMAFAVAADLSRSRIVLAGIDYSYWHGYARIAESLSPAPDETDSLLWRGLKTNSRMVSYKDALMALWSMVRMTLPVYSMSEGIVDEIPEVSFDEVIHGHWPPLLTHEEFLEKAEHHIKEFSHFGEAVGL